MNKATIAEINRLKERIPSKDRMTSALFTIVRAEDVYVIDEVASNDFAHITEAVMGDEKYLIGHYEYEFDTIQGAVSCVKERRSKYHGVMPCLAILGGFTRDEMDEIRTIKKILLLNDKYLAFLYGLNVSDEYETKIID